MSRRLIFLVFALSVSGSIGWSDQIVNLSSFAANQYTYAPSPAFSPVAINNAGQVIGQFGYVLSPGQVEYAAVLYSGGMTTVVYGPTEEGTFLNGLNDLGQAAGYITISGGHTIPASFANGQIGFLPGFNFTGGVDSLYSQAYGINNAGTIVGGGSLIANGVFEDSAFLAVNGNVTILGTFGGIASVAYAINNSGEVVGVYTTAANQQRLFSYAGGVMTDLGYIGNNLIVTGLNDSGQIVGYYTNGSGQRNGFLYSGGTVTVLPGLGGGSTIASGINGLGQIVGTSTTASGASDAFLYANGVTVDLNSLLPASAGWDLNSASGINNLGQIIGDGTYSGQESGFLLSTGTPEPGNVALLFVGGLGLAGIRVLRVRCTRTWADISGKPLRAEE